MIQRRASGVACLEAVHQCGAEPLGTCFLIASDLVLTCRHVVAGERLDRLRVRFGGLEPAVVVDVREEAWRGPSSPDPRRDLDAILLRLGRPVHEAMVLPLSADAVLYPARRAYLVGYPYGSSRPQVSLHESAVIDANDEVLQYRTPSNPGSSGSPIFDDDWEVVGIHTRGASEVRRATTPGFHAVNEGVRIWRVEAGIDQFL